MAGGGSVNKQLAHSDWARFGRQDFAGYVWDDQRKSILGTQFEICHRNGWNVEICDTDSSNGTQLNGRDISDGGPRELSDGAELSLADGSANIVIWVS